MSQLFYTDESGDLGWSFTLPYGKGGSSRFLVIATVVLPQHLDHRPERVMRDVYKASKWDHTKEKKWIDASPKSRLHFAQKALQLTTHFPDIAYHAIAVQKSRVASHIRDDGNKLYNYMVKLSLASEMAKHPQVDFFPDPRSIKVDSGNSMNDYLAICLGLDLNAPTVLRTQKIESKFSKNLQFADMLAGTIFSHFEFGDSQYFNLLSQNIILKKLYF
jgi:hypothetical protein